MDMILAIVAAFGGGAGIAGIITAILSKKKTDAEAENTNIKSILEIDGRLNERMAKLEERVAKLEEENLKLKEENLKLRHKLGLTPEEDVIS